MKRLQGALCGNCHIYERTSIGMAIAASQASKAEQTAKQTKLHERMADRRGQHPVPPSFPPQPPPAPPGPRPPLPPPPGGFYGSQPPHPLQQLSLNNPNHHTAGFQQSRAALLGSGPDQITFDFAIRQGTKKSTDQRFGKVKIDSNLDDTMIDVKAAVLEELNKTWTNQNEAPLLLSEITLRFPNNVNFATKTSTKSCLDFYNYYHLNPITRAQYLPKLKSAARQSVHPSNRQMDLEVYIDTQWFASRMKASESSAATSSSTMQPPAKRQRREGSTGSSLMSRFVGMSNVSALAAAQETWSVFQVVKADVLVDSTNGGVNIIWPLPEDVAADPQCIITSRICPEVMNSGVNKYVYKLIFAGSTRTFAAKRIKDMGRGVDQVSEEENHASLRQEVLAIKQAAWLWSEFLKLAAERGVNVYKDFEWTAVDLYREVKVAGKQDDRGQVQYELGRTWLVEPKRGQIVEKYSGTVTHPRPDNVTIVERTAYAYAHFIYETCRHTQVYTDLQATEATLSDDRDGRILFDPMIQTKTRGHSGPGDFGQEGIDKWVDAHAAQCGDLCHKLGLAPLAPAEANIQLREKAASPASSTHSSQSSTN